MKTLLAAIGLFSTLGIAAASAAPGACSGQRASQQWSPVEAAIAKAETLGYSVDEIKRSKGCWKIEGYDRNGAEIEIYFDGASGEVIKPHDGERLRANRSDAASERAASP